MEWCAGSSCVEKHDWHVQEIVVFRDDLQKRMRKLCLLKPNGEDFELPFACTKSLPNAPTGTVVTGLSGTTSVNNCALILTPCAALDAAAADEDVASANSPEAMFEHLCATLLQQSHLCPVRNLPHVCPVIQHCTLLSLPSITKSLAGFVPQLQGLSSLFSPVMGSS